MWPTQATLPAQACTAMKRRGPRVDRQESPQTVHRPVSRAYIGTNKLLVWPREKSAYNGLAQSPINSGPAGLASATTPHNTTHKAASSFSHQASFDDRAFANDTERASRSTTSPNHGVAWHEHPSCHWNRTWSKYPGLACPSARSFFCNTCPCLPLMCTTPQANRPEPRSATHTRLYSYHIHPCATTAATCGKLSLTCSGLSPPTMHCPRRPTHATPPHHRSPNTP